MDRSELRTEAERRLWDAFPRGEMVDLGPGDPTAEGFDPDTWGEDRCVRGEVITRLLLGACERQPGYVARIVLAGARIIGEIDLRGGQTEHELLLHRCWVDEPIELDSRILECSRSPQGARPRGERTRLAGFQLGCLCRQPV